MKTIINDLFTQLNLSQTILESGSLFKFEDTEKKYYTLIIEADNLTEILERQSEYFDEAKNVLGTQWFDKNATLLILQKIDLISEEIHNEVLKVEEDPYLFKKHVLLYKYSESEQLKLALYEQQLLIKDFLDHNLLNDQIYEKHKSNLNDNEWESLIYRIAQKIPLINLNIEQSDGLSILVESNKEVVESGPYKDLNFLLEDIFFERTYNDIDSMDANLIFNLLKVNTDEN